MYRYRSNKTIHLKNDENVYFCLLSNRLLDAIGVEILPFLFVSLVRKFEWTFHNAFSLKVCNETVPLSSHEEQYTALATRCYDLVQQT